MPDLNVSLSQGNPITVSVNGSGAATATVAAGGTANVTVTGAIPNPGAGTVIVSSGGIADLTSTQQNQISQGVVVVTTDGFRFIYSGAGSKTDQSSYVLLADTTPTWASIEGKPTTDGITEGASNLYHTTARAAAAAPVQSVAGRTGAIVLAASDIASGTIAAARLGSGTAESTGYLAGDQTWKRAPYIYTGSGIKPNQDSPASVGTFAVVCGGFHNEASGYCAVVCGGVANTADGSASSVLGGSGNNTAGYANAHIVGSNITATAADTTHVNGLRVVTSGITFANGSVQTVAYNPLALAFIATTGSASHLVTGTVPAERLPLATTTTAGAVVVGAGLSVTSGTVSANVTSVAGRTGAVAIAAGDIASGTIDPARLPSHQHAVSDVTGLQTALDAKQAAGSYATLVGGTVPAAQLPSYVDDVIEAANLAAFPATGEAGKIYVALATNKTYRWSGSAYIEISASPGSTDAVPEGASNLYHTTARAAAAAPVQSVAGRTGAVVLAASDIASGTIAAARLASGTASSSTFLRGDQTWSAAPVTSVDGLTGAVTITKAEVYDFSTGSAPSGATGGSGVWTWSLPSWAKFVEFYAVGGGSGGASGRRGAAGTLAGGGGGGAGGNVYKTHCLVSDLSATTVWVSVGWGGAGGAAVAANDTNGNMGVSGTASHVRLTNSTGPVIIYQDQFAYQSNGGTSTGGGGATGNFGMQWMVGNGAQGGAGGDGSTAVASPLLNSIQLAGPSGGAGGGGISAANAVQSGGTSNYPYRARFSDVGGAGAAGGTSGASGVSGGNAHAFLGRVGIGGGGGASSTTADAGAGGNGGFPGGGGGGGGASRNGFNSGAGGNGGNGLVRIIVWG